MFSFGLVVKWTIWGSTKQWFHILLVFYACLFVWLHKNDLDCLLKILIPGLLFQSFLSGNMCFTRLSRWLYAKLCLGNTDVKCHESLGMFGFVKWVKLTDDMLNSFMRLGLVVLNSFLTHESLRLTNEFRTIVSQQEKYKWLPDGGQRMLRLVLLKICLLFFVNTSFFFFLCFLDFSLPVMFAYLFFILKMPANCLLDEHTSFILNQDRVAS